MDKLTNASTIISLISIFLFLMTFIYFIHFIFKKGKAIISKISFINSVLSFVLFIFLISFNVFLYLTILNKHVSDDLESIKWFDLKETQNIIVILNLIMGVLMIFNIFIFIFNKGGKNYIWLNDNISYFNENKVNPDNIIVYKSSYYVLSNGSLREYKIFDKNIVINTNNSLNKSYIDKIKIDQFKMKKNNKLFILKLFSMILLIASFVIDIIFLVAIEKGEGKWIINNSFQTNNLFESKYIILILISAILNFLTLSLNLVISFKSKDNLFIALFNALFITVKVLFIIGFNYLYRNLGDNSLINSNILAKNIYTWLLLDYSKGFGYFFIADVFIYALINVYQTISTINFLAKYYLYRKEYKNEKNIKFTN